MDDLPQFLHPLDPAKIEEDQTKMKNKVEKVRKGCTLIQKQSSV